MYAQYNYYGTFQPDPNKFWWRSPLAPIKYTPFYTIPPPAPKPGVEEQLPLAFSVEQNYPNPFNPHTTISFSLESPAWTSLIIYNLLGQKVSTLVDEYLDRGQHSVIWDGRNDHGAPVTSGVYFYTIRSGERLETRKMTLLREEEEKMRYIIAILTIFAAVSSASAAEITLGLDRCAVLNSRIDTVAGSGLALHFSLPREVAGKEIMFADIHFSIPAVDLQADSLLEFDLFALLADWSESDINFDDSQNITDSLIIGTCLLKLGETNEFHVDITPYLRDISEGTRSNFGLIGVSDLLGGGSIRLPEDPGSPVRDQARVRIVYK